MDPRELALAYSLSSIAGLRASLTILAVTIAVHMHAFAPPRSLGWLASDDVLWIAGVLAVADFFGDKVPVIDHVLHAVHAVLAPVAGGVAAASLDPTGGTGAGVVAILGAANALGVHGIKSATRVGTTVTTAGFLNPIVSFIEDAIATIGLALTFFTPFLVAAIALFTTILMLVVGRRVVTWFRRGRGTAA